MEFLRRWVKSEWQLNTAILTRQIASQLSSKCGTRQRYLQVGQRQTTDPIWYELEQIVRMELLLYAGNAQHNGK